MIVKIMAEDCQHIKDCSDYNNNYYKLPFKVNGCDFILEEARDDEKYCVYSLGKSAKEFVPEFYLNEYSDDILSPVFIFDSEKISTENKFT